MARKQLSLLVIVLTSVTVLLLWFILLDKTVHHLSENAQAATLDAPVVMGVTPTTAPNDLDTPIVITGTGFTDGVSGTLATFGSSSLADVTWVSSTTLSATVPWGLDAGVYTLTVVNPDGETGLLPNAFTVTQGIGVWTSGGPYGGVVSHVVLNPVTPTQVYASVGWSGLFASHDATDTWHPAIIGAFPERPTFNAADPQTMYVSFGAPNYRSDDGGLTWQSLSHASPCNELSRLFAHPTQPGTVYKTVSCQVDFQPWGGLYKSTDWGNTWITMTTGMTNTNVIALAFHPDIPEIMYLGTYSGTVYTSTNGGDTWSFAAALPSIFYGGFYVNPYGSHEVWAASGGCQPYPSLFKSLNPSLTSWTPVGPWESVVSVTFHPIISGTLYAAVGDGYVSSNNGDNWQPVGLPLPPHACMCGCTNGFAIDPQNPSSIYAATGYGIYKSTDTGNTWSDANQNLAGVLPTSLAISPFDPQELYANTNIGPVLKSNNGGQSWQMLDVPYPGWDANVTVDPFVPERIYFNSLEVFSAECQNMPCIGLSEDGGQSYRVITFTLPTTFTGWVLGGSMWLTPDPLVAGHILLDMTIYQPGRWDEPLRVLFASNDHGEHWAYSGFSSPGGSSVIAFDPVNPGIIYLGSNSSGVYKSMDSGITWQSLSSWPGPGMVTAMAVHPTQPNIVFAHGSSFFVYEPPQGLYRSSDGGSSWEYLTSQPPRPFWGLAYALTNPPTLYAGGLDSGLWRSRDNGQTWEIAAGMSQGTIRAIATATDGERVFVYAGISAGAVSEPGLLNQGETQAGVNTRLLGSGVFRLTTLPGQWVYLPLVSMGGAP